MYFSQAEFPCTSGRHLHTIPILGKEWRVSLDFKPTDYSHAGWTNLLHLTLGHDIQIYGDRYPAIFFHPAPTHGMTIVAAISGNKNFVTNTMTDRPLVGEWTSLEISQEQAGGKFVYKIVIGGKIIFSVEIEKPEEMCNVKVYASDPWYPAQHGSIKALLIQTKLGEFYFGILLLD